MKRFLALCITTLMLASCYYQGEISAEKAMLVAPGTKKAVVLQNLGTPKKVKVSQLLPDGRSWEIWEYEIASFTDYLTDPFWVEMYDGVVARSGAPSQFQSDPDRTIEIRHR